MQRHIASYNLAGSPLVAVTASIEMAPPLLTGIVEFVREVNALRPAIDREVALQLVVPFVVFLQE